MYHIYTHTLTHAVYADTSSMNAVFEFSGDRRVMELGLSDVERRELQREETCLDLERNTKQEGTLLHAGHWLGHRLIRLMYTYM